ncbi:MAG TPA: NADP-dependent oxidoreductase [Mycobacterium sp.]|nr:NADP-dependent oxidoreductase [Mycobacterium sp.]
MKPVRFDRYGGVDVLEVREVPVPAPGAGEVLVEVKAAGINPGEAMIRQGVFHEIFPATFPSGQGSDLAGVVTEVGPGVELFSVGDEVLGFTNNRASHAEFVVVPVDQLTAKPPAVSWEAAGGLFVAGTTAYAAVGSMELSPSDAVAVGTIAVQLAKRSGARVLGIAGPSNDQWLAAHGVIPVDYGEGLAGRLRSAAPGGRVDAFLDFFGGGYVELAITELGIAPQRIDTIIDFPALERFGVKFVGNQDAADAAVLAELAALIAAGQLEVPIAEVIPLAEVQRAYSTLERRHTRGKIILRP